MSDNAPHVVSSYEQELQTLRRMLAEMVGMVESQLAHAADAMMQQDSERAAIAVEQDAAVDHIERELEQFVVRLLARRQPLAVDLREIVAALKMSGDLERIGDYAANVAKRSIVLAGFNLPFSLSGIGQMARLVQQNVKLAADAITERDAAKAVLVCQSDAAIDDLYNTIFRELITYMMEDPRNISPCAHLLFIAKNLERIGDHATNVAETVHYAATGQPIAEARPKRDQTPYSVVRPHA